LSMRAQRDFDSPRSGGVKSFDQDTLVFDLSY
jgi:hypothetical protein